MYNISGDYLNYDHVSYILVNNGAIFRIVPASDAAANPTSYSFSSLPSQQQGQGQGQQKQLTLSTLPANTPSKVTIVGVKGLQSYEPNPINIKVGDTVTWINADVVSHTVTSGKDYDPNKSGKLFNSGAILTNDVYQLKFAKPGTFDYFCLFHPDMKGQVIVSK